MKYLFFFTLISVTLSCSSARYFSDYLGEGPNLIGTTYNVEGDCQYGINRIQEIRVSNSIHSHFQSRGFERSENPDILIQFFIKEERNSYLAQECDYYSQWGYGEKCSTKVIDYTEGSIVIDVIQTKSESIVWHGAIYSPQFDYIKDPDQKINQYVNKLLGDYLFTQGK